MPSLHIEALRSSWTQTLHASSEVHRPCHFRRFAESLGLAGHVLWPGTQDRGIILLGSRLGVRAGVGLRWHCLLDLSSPPLRIAGRDAVPVPGEYAKTKALVKNMAMRLMKAPNPVLPVFHCFFSKALA